MASIENEPIFQELSDYKKEWLRRKKGEDLKNITKIELIRVKNIKEEELKEFDLVRWGSQKAKDCKIAYIIDSREKNKEQSEGMKKFFLGPRAYEQLSQNQQAIVLEFMNEKQAIEFATKLIRKVTLEKNRNPKLKPPFFKIVNGDSRRIYWLGAGQTDVNSQKDVYVNFKEHPYSLIVSLEQCKDKEGKVPPELRSLIDRMIEDSQDGLWTNVGDLDLGKSSRLVLNHKINGENFSYALGLVSEWAVQTLKKQKNNSFAYLKTEDNNLPWDYQFP